MLPVTVQRSKWFRGQGATDSALLCPDGKMCCLGFVAIAGGATPADIDGRQTPAEVLVPLEVFKPLVALGDDQREELYNTALCERLMETNDGWLPEKDREARLIKLGALANIAFTFVD